MAAIVNNPPALPNAANQPTVEALRQFDQDLVNALMREMLAHAQRLNIALTTDTIPAFALSWVQGATSALVGRQLLLADFFTTGDTKVTLKTVADAGWVMMNDGTIGSALSGATTRANDDTQALHALIFNNLNDSNAPMQNSAGAFATRAAYVTAAGAWASNARASLPKQLGRALAIAGAGGGLTARTLGDTVGLETETPTVAKTAAHQHQGLNGGQIFSLLGTGGTLAVTYTGGTEFTNGPTQTVGSSSPLNIMQPSTFWNIMIKL